LAKPIRQVENLLIAASWLSPDHWPVQEKVTKRLMKSHPGEELSSHYNIVNTWQMLPNGLLKCRIELQTFVADITTPIRFDPLPQLLRKGLLQLRKTRLTPQIVPLQQNPKHDLVMAQNRTHPAPLFPTLFERPPAMLLDDSVNLGHQPDCLG
jgi:hypothetical protein